jgi:hypothetical protein
VTRRVSFLYIVILVKSRGVKKKKRLGFNIFNLGFVFLSLPRACSSSRERPRAFSSLYFRERYARKDRFLKRARVDWVKKKEKD